MFSFNVLFLNHFLVTFMKGAIYIFSLFRTVPHTAHILCNHSVHTNTQNSSCFWMKDLLSLHAKPHTSLICKWSRLTIISLFLLHFLLTITSKLHACKAAACNEMRLFVFTEADGCHLKPIISVYLVTMNVFAHMNVQSLREHRMLIFCVSIQCLWVLLDQQLVILIN